MPERSTVAQFDEFARLGDANSALKWLDRPALFFLFVMVAAAPHSIAATQIAWGCGMVATLLRFCFSPRPRFRLRPLDMAFSAYAVWSLVSSFFSYEPAVSINKMRTVALFLIFYFAIWNIRNLRTALLCGLLLIVSCCVNLLWTPLERLIGRGVEIHGVDTNGPLGKALLTDGDTLLKVDGRKVSKPDDLVAALGAKDTVKVLFYRPDFEFVVDVKAADLAPGNDAAGQLGIRSWDKSHNWRSMGFYNHYVTYAEVVQLISALILGLLVATFRKGRQAETANAISAFLSSKLFLTGALAFALLALLLTVTRASQLGFVVAAALITMLAASRKLALAAVVVAIPIAIGGLVFLQQSRQIGFFDSKDDSTLYRMMMWRDGTRLLTESPRSLIVGVGMDSIQKHWQEWDMFDGGKKPLGHFHSMPLQLAVERGIPALLAWLMIVFLLGREFLRGLRVARVRDWRAYGLLLGAIGALAGFFTSGLVHSNLLDSEVAMVFFLIMALGVSAARGICEREA